MQAALWGALVGFSIGFLGNILANSFIAYYKPDGADDSKKYYWRVLKSGSILTAILLGGLFILYFSTFFI
jgi:hypothetical protein